MRQIRVHFQNALLFYHTLCTHSPDGSNHAFARHVRFAQITCILTRNNFAHPRYRLGVCPCVSQTLEPYRNGAKQSQYLHCGLPQILVFFATKFCAPAILDCDTHFKSELCPNG